MTRLFATRHYPKIGRYERGRFAYRLIIHIMPLEDPRTFLAAVAVCLPPFWPSNSRVWFVQLEAQFCKCGITTLRMKYKGIVCAPPAEYATEIQDLLFDPSDEEPYEKLKHQLIARVANSEHQKLRQLLTAEELGD